MSLAPSISPITAVNPFDTLPAEVVECILDCVDTKEARLAAEYACKLFSSFAPEFLEKGEEPGSFFLRQIPKDEFYPLFKKRMRQLKVEFPSDDFMTKIADFNYLFLRYSTIVPISTDARESLYNFDPTLIVTLNDLFFEDLIETYVKQAIEKITPDNFTQRILFLEANFREKGTALGLETLLRRRIKKHGTEQHAQRLAEIEKIRREFADPAPNAPRFLQTQRPLIAELEQEKEKLEKKRLELCGPNKYDGTIDAAWKAKEKAKAEFAAQLRLADERFLAAIVESDEFVERCFSHYAQANRYLSGLIAAENNYHDSLTHHSSLVAELKIIAQFDRSGQIIRGRLFEIKQELQPDALEARVRPRMNLMAQFYEELNRDFEDREAVRRSEALSPILKRYAELR